MKALARAGIGTLSCSIVAELRAAWGANGGELASVPRLVANQALWLFRVNDHRELLVHQVPSTAYDLEHASLYDRNVLGFSIVATPKAGFWTVVHVKTLAT
jgi:hypothetical protein